MSTEYQAELTKVIQSQVGSQHLVTKWVVVVEMSDGENRMISKMTSEHCTYWDWMGLLSAVTADMTVDWTEVAKHTDYEGYGMPDEDEE